MAHLARYRESREQRDNIAHLNMEQRTFCELPLAAQFIESRPSRPFRIFLWPAARRLAAGRLGRRRFRPSGARARVIQFGDKPSRAERSRATSSRPTSVSRAKLTHSGKLARACPLSRAAAAQFARLRSRERSASRSAGRRRKREKTFL